jgi:hypothetical protein
MRRLYGFILLALTATGSQAAGSRTLSKRHLVDRSRRIRLLSAFFFGSDAAQ